MWLSLRGIIRATLFVLLVWAGLQAMDWWAYGRAQRIYEAARSVARAGVSEPGYQVSQDGDTVVVSVSDVQRDICNAYTGGLWGPGFLMPRSHGVRERHPGVRSRSGTCLLSHSNTLLFRFPARRRSSY
jgi:hypothetical protein